MTAAAAVAVAVAAEAAEAAVADPAAAAALAAAGGVKRVGGRSGSRRVAGGGPSGQTGRRARPVATSPAAGPGGGNRRTLAVEPSALSQVPPSSICTAGPAGLVERLLSCRRVAVRVTSVISQAADLSSVRPGRFFEQVRLLLLNTSPSGKKVFLFTWS